MTEDLKMEDGDTDFVGLKNGGRTRRSGCAEISAAEW